MSARLGTEPIELVRKERTVPLAPVAAFELFTAGIARWWPLASHSIGGEGATVTVEGGVGGRIVETTSDGSRHPWADIIAWDPPHRLALAWHPQVEPVAATIVDVRFEPDGDGSRVLLEHRAWEELGDGPGRAARADYETGWDAVIGLFVEAATSPARA